MRRNRSADSTPSSPFRPDYRPGSPRDLPQQTAQTDAPVTSEPRVLHHPNEVTALLGNEDLSSCHLSLRLDAPLDTATCKALTQLLQRADVHLGELSLTLSDTLDADALAALLAAAEAHRDSLAPAGFQLQGTGVPLPDSLRLVIAGSRLCLELGAPTVRPLLFGHHLLRSEEWEKDGDRTLDALNNFLQCKVSLFDSAHDLLDSLSLLAQKTHDFALMRACSVLSPGSQVKLSALPDAQLVEFLAQGKIPYRLELHLWSAPTAIELAQWLSQPRPLFQGLSLYGFPQVHAACWVQTFDGLVAQPDLQGVRISLMPFDRPPVLRDDDSAPIQPIQPTQPSQRRLPHLMFWWGDEPYSDADKRHAKFVTDLTQYLNPEHLVLRLLSQTNIECVIDQLSCGSPNQLARLMGLHVGWTADAVHPVSGKSLKHMFSQITAAGMTCLNGGPPDSEPEWWGLAQRSTGKSLDLSLRPGPQYGLTDHTKVNSTLRFQRQ